MPIERGGSMVHEAARRVTEYLLDTVGDDLRTVTIVRPDDFDVTYLSDALKREYSAETFATVVDTFRLNQPLFSPDIEGAPVGERRAILHYHEHAFVLQFPFSATETILISVDRDVGRDLLGFIEDCRQLVRDDT